MLINGGRRSGALRCAGERNSAEKGSSRYPSEAAECRERRASLSVPRTAASGFVGAFDSLDGGSIPLRAVEVSGKSERREAALLWPVHLARRALAGMAHIEDDFAAYTTIGDRVAPPAEQRKPVHASSVGPSFTVPPKLEVRARRAWEAVGTLEEMCTSYWARRMLARPGARCATASPHLVPSLPHDNGPPTLFSRPQPFLLLAKSARGAGAANLITQATAAPGVYVFSELLEQPSIKDVRASPLSCISVTLTASSTARER